MRIGYDQGLMGGVNQSTDYIRLMGLGHLGEDGSPVITETLLQGGIMAIFYFGTLVGCLAGGAFGDRYGRIGTIGLGALWAIFGASLQTAAMNPAWMLGSRFVNGVGTGILNGIVPAWASELSDYSSRGTFIAMEFTLNIFGVVVAYWLAYAVSFIDNGESQIRWRFPIAFQILPLLFLLASCWAFPESPRWLVKTGRNEEALYVLRRLRGTPDAGEPDIAEGEFHEIRNVIELEKSSEGTSYIHMLFGLKSGKLHTGRRVQLVIWLQIIQCWTGIAGVTMYGPSKSAFYLSTEIHPFSESSFLTYSTSHFPNCRLRSRQDPVGGRPQQHLLHVRDSDLRIHDRPHWTTMDSILGLCRSGYCHVSRRRLVTRRIGCQSGRKHRHSEHMGSGRRVHGVSVHLCLRRHLAHRSLAVSG